MSIQQLIDHISKHISLSPSDIAFLEKQITDRKYRKGQYLVQQGDVCRHQSFVIEGCMRTYHVDDEGQEHTVMFAIEDWWTGDMGSFIKQAPADFNIQCLENSHVLQIGFDELEMFYDKIPVFDKYMRLIIQNAYVATQKRIVSTFSKTAKDRYVEFRDRYPQIEQRVPQYMIASYLGITKEFLSKIRNQLIHE